MPISLRRLFIAGSIWCVAGSANAQPTGPVLCCSPNDNTVVAIVGGESIRMRDLDAYSRLKDAKKLFQLNQQLYDFREQMLDDLVGERLLAQEAARLGVSVGQLLRDNLTVELVTEVDIVETFERVNTQQAAPGAPHQNVSLEVARPLIVTYLEGRRRSEARSRYIQTLREAAKKASKEISIHLDSPRQRIPTSPSDPTRGNGPVEIVQFADFECPYCKQLEPMLNKVLALFPGKVKLVWKDYPLPNHEFAIGAAEAGRCAQEQGKFWEYSDVLFARQQALTMDDLKRHAKLVGMDMESFDGCLASAKYRADVATTYQRASSYGIAATPTVFINGRMVTGVAPLETYQRIISRELQASAQ